MLNSLHEDTFCKTVLGYSSKRGGMAGVFQGRAALLRGISRGQSPREIPRRAFPPEKSEEKRLMSKSELFSKKIWVIVAPLVIWTTYFNQNVVLGLFLNYFSCSFRKENCNKWLLMIYFLIFFSVLGLLRNT